MKRKITILLTIFILLLSLCACGGKDRSAPDEGTISLRLIDGAGTGSLVLAGDAVYTVSLEDVSVLVGEEKGSTDDLFNGMMVTINYRGAILDDSPRQFEEVVSIAIPCPRSEMVRDPNGAFYDLCSLYLNVLDTLWHTSVGMNQDVEYISVDLSSAPGAITEEEKSAIAWAFANRHESIPLELSIDELIENGYINLSELKWKRGELFTIAAGSDTSTVGSVSFLARKWRSGNEAVSLLGCTSDAQGKDSWEEFAIGRRS